VEIRFQPKGEFCEFSFDFPLKFFFKFLPGLPQTPIFAKQLQSGTDWILLGWRPGFDGGEKQTLELELRAVDPFTGRPSSENEPEHIVFGSGNWTTLSLFLVIFEGFLGILMERNLKIIRV